ncbi:ATP-dependent DNA helicase PIF1 [Mycena indigotica]|uniref:ATP-dependent DNA helicase PIF1 n=1 Tax=Mycena indigotica TaxID=2126181 RepID=A0A8H6SLY3_9AGAR|nr:ATP-dependent DNA helicase PIF1 [Mycena indigotica]KAF7301260.1 ATP-dependent DNA helicase PIF1 [Mycena indigotica]
MTSRVRSSSSTTMSASYEHLQGSYGWTDTLKSIHYGPGVTATALPKLIQRLNVKKGLIVTGRSLYTKTDVVSKIEALLTSLDAFAGSFTDIGEHTPVAGINACIKVLEESKADFIVAVGGGSPVDGAKAIRYRFMEKTGATSPIPQIAIPTTLSAAEYSIGAGYTDENGLKVAVSHQELAPAGIILDAELTLPTPRRLWISTGIRAVDHCVESLYRPFVSPPAKILCYAALRDLFEYLPISQADPTNIEARHKLQLATWMSLWPTKWERYSALGLSHALGHKLGAAYSIPHGITSCLTLAPVVALQARTASAADKQALARCLFYLEEPTTGSVEGDVLKLSELITGLVDRLGLKSTLGQYNVPREDLPKVAQRALQPELNTLEDVVALLEGIY